jgi:hypothetical protein
MEEARLSFPLGWPFLSTRKTLMHRRRARVMLLLVLWTCIGTVAFSAEDDSNKLLATPDVAPGLLAHWTFDDTDTGVIADASGDESLQIRGEFPHAPGVLGQALELAGAHQLQARPISPSGSMPQIAFSVWVRPVDLSGYREIYRQECPERLLFSFQNGGTILSLGLNIGGYIECDAPVDPSQVVDGAWHHAAASFDGQIMRVYLDGQEIGHLQRPGVIVTHPQASAFVGSSGGAGEHFSRRHGRLAHLLHSTQHGPHRQSLPARP